MHTDFLWEIFMKKRQSHLGLCFLLSVVCFLASCATSSHLNKVYVTNSSRVDLLSPSAILQKIDEYQYFEGEFGEKSFSALLYLQADSQRIQILLLNEFGIEAGSIFYDGETAELESDFFPKNLKCEYIILDLQNAYADSDALKNHYEKYNLDFEEEFSDEKKLRKISKEGETIEEITITENQIVIKNVLRNYKYTLTKAEN